MLHLAVRLALAERFRVGLGLEPDGSAIVVIDAAGAEDRLRAAGVMAAMRAGRLRTSWHVYNTEDDVERVLELMNAPVRSR